MPPESVEKTDKKENSISYRTRPIEPFESSVSVLLFFVVVLLLMLFDLPLGVLQDIFTVRIKA